MSDIHTPLLTILYIDRLLLLLLFKKKKTKGNSDNTSKTEKAEAGASTKEGKGLVQLEKVSGLLGRSKGNNKTSLYMYYGTLL